MQPLGCAVMHTNPLILGLIIIDRNGVLKDNTKMKILVIACLASGKKAFLVKTADSGMKG
jgi:hypothetical protein